MCGAMCHFYFQLKRVFRLDQGFSLPWVASNAVLQGCSLSVLATNCMYAILGRRIQKILPETKATYFVDDKNFLSTISRGRGNAFQPAADIDAVLLMIEQFMTSLDKK